MNIVRLLTYTLPVWGLASVLVYFQFGMRPCLAQSSGYLACLFGAIAAEWLQKMVAESKTPYSGAAFLAGSLPRTFFPLIFLLFSLKYYHNTLDKITQYAIIGSYFAYYPLVLSVSVRQAIRNAKTQNAFSGGKTIAPLSEEKTESAVIDE